jgi:ferredoxin
MRACPTNTLQPTGLQTGLAGFFTPFLNPVTGPCEAGCTRCGHVCPTGAIRALGPEEKPWARIGGASVVRETCIAWEKGMRCLVCYEVCPFGAVRLEHVAGSPVPVPFVDGKRCNGCGLCEFSCPVDGVRAILVSPRNALRMDSGSYIAKGREAGYSYEPRKAAEPLEGEGGVHAPLGPGGLPPGFEK